MKFDYVFKHVKKSEKLVEYAESKLEKLQKFDEKTFGTNLMFSEERSSHSQKVVELIINTKNNKRVVARGYGDNFYQAVDQCVQRMSKQLQKTKEKKRSHRQHQHSDSYALECLNDQLEWDYSKIKGAAKQKAA